MAFHHRLFRRDNPDLCLQMVCQKSRERQGPGRKSLPPKKRGLTEKALQSNLIESSAMSSAACVSADDRSVVSSTTSSTGSFQENQKNLPSSILSQSAEIGSVPFICNDPELVAKTMQQRDQMEVLRAAKVMLYDSFMKALKGDEPKHQKKSKQGK